MVKWQCLPLFIGHSFKQHYMCLCPVEMLHNENPSGPGESYKTYK